LRMKGQNDDQINTLVFPAGRGGRSVCSPLSVHLTRGKKRKQEKRRTRSAPFSVGCEEEIRHKLTTITIKKGKKERGGKLKKRNGAGHRPRDRARKKKGRNLHVTGKEKKKTRDCRGDKKGRRCNLSYLSKKNRGGWPSCISFREEGGEGGKKEKKE